MGIGHGADEAVRPVEGIGGNLHGHFAQVCRHFVRVGVDRQGGVKGVGAEADPLQSGDLVGHVPPQLQNSHDPGAADANGAVFGFCFRGGLAVGIVGGALVVGRQDVLYVLHRDFALGNQGPGDVVAFRRELSVRTIPADGPGIEVAAHEPGTGGVVHMVGVTVGAKSQPGVEPAV